LHSNVKYTNLVIVEEYLVGFSGHFHRVLCESR
jgi:hypothetical protein